MLYKLSTSSRQWSITEPQVMGILNCTPDSFYSASRNLRERDIAFCVERMVDEGASIIDVGGVSTR
ncbi:MAG: dihydropteroate synthase, partial [Prevotella sp.]|nr:dihydropteroate synthase [Prevotella sp.]